MAYNRNIKGSRHSPIYMSGNVVRGIGTQPVFVPGRGGWESAESDIHTFHTFVKTQMYKDGIVNVAIRREKGAPELGDIGLAIAGEWAIVSYMKPEYQAGLASVPCPEQEKNLAPDSLDANGRRKPAGFPSLTMSELVAHGLVPSIAGTKAAKEAVMANVSSSALTKEDILASMSAAEKKELLFSIR